MAMNRETLELIIVGILLAFPNEATKIDLEIEDFATHPWKLVFQAIRSVLSAGLEVDVFSVKEKVGDIVDLSDLAYAQKDAASPANIGHYAGLLKKYGREERLKILCVKTLTAIEDKKDVDKIKGRLLTRLSEIDEREERLDLTMKDLSRLAVDYIETAQEARDNGKTIGIPTGIYEVDKNCGGLHNSNLIVVGARPGMGKTALALSLAVNMGKKGFKVGFVSTEMSGVEVGLRLMSLISNVPSEKLRNANLSEQDYSKLMLASGKLKDLPIRVFDRPSCTLSDIMVQARAWMLTGGVDVLMVDYLQRLQSDVKQDSRVREVGKYASGLKTVARSMKIPVIALSQINRSSTKREEKRPTMSDLRDSGEIEQEADMVWLLHRESVYDDNANKEDAEIIIDKNRHGPIAMVKTCWNPEIMRWGNNGDDYY